MSSSKFDVLAALMLSGEASEKQKIEFEEILKSSKEKQIAFEKLKLVWRVDLGNKGDAYQKQREYLWGMYQAEKQPLKRKGLRHHFAFKAAAVLLLLITAGIAFYQLFEQDVSSQLAIANDVIKKTQPGEKLKTRLPDGTIVHLNAGSSLTYAENFTDSNRIVRLTGEGYFDVVEDKRRPFTVRTQTMDITALGTAFSVNAYQQNLFDHVALASGKLLIKNIENQEVRIDSGKTITLSRGDYSFSESDLDYMEQIAWKDGILYFNNNNFEEIAVALAMNYGVEFQGSELGSLRDTYTGAFKDESLENILKILSFSMDFQYEINGKEILIRKNKKPDT